MRLFLGLIVLCATLARGSELAVEALLELPRDRPAHYVDAVLALVDLGAEGPAGQIAAEMVAADFSDAQLVELVAEVGSARLLRVARVAPAAADWVAAALRAAESAATSPERLGELIADVTTGSPEAARAAMLQLERTGAAGVARCLVELAEADNPKHEARLREALVALYPASGPALTVAIGDADEAVRVQAAYAWGRLADLDAIRSPLPAALVAGPAALRGADDALGRASRWSFARLTGRPVDTRAAAGFVEGAIGSLLAGEFPFAVDADGLIAWPAERGGERERLPAAEAAARIAASLADSLAQLRPGDPAAERQANVLGLEAGRRSPGRRDPSELPTFELTACLEQALDASLPRAAVACCRVLGERADAAALASIDARPGPLARALRAPHDAVRFAALEAVMAINPPAPFPGSSGVAPALAYFAAGSDTRRAVVMAPQIARAASAAGLLKSAGLDAAPANNGLDGLDAAIASPDVEAVLLDADTIRTSARETLFRLRREPATATTPVALLAADGRLGAAESLAADHQRVLAWPRLHTAEDAAALVERLARLAPRTEPTPEERLAHAERARGWIARVLESGPRFYRLRDRAAEFEPLLITTTDGSSYAALADLGGPAAQRRLAEQASRSASTLERRRAAAAAFARAVDREGLLLTGDEIRLQYDRYNASVSADDDAQAVLGEVLDTIEARRSRDLEANPRSALP